MKTETWRSSSAFRGKKPIWKLRIREYLVGMNTSEMTNRLKDYQGKAAEKLKDYRGKATELATNAGRTTDHYVRENTWAAIGAAALLGCVVGFLLSNTGSHDD